MFDKLFMLEWLQDVENQEDDATRPGNCEAQNINIQLVSLLGRRQKVYLDFIRINRINDGQSLLSTARTALFSFTKGYHKNIPTCNNLFSSTFSILCTFDDTRQI